MDCGLSTRDRRLTKYLYFFDMVEAVQFSNIQEGNMIIVQDLKKAYGDVKALRGVSFEIGQGEIVGLLGPNGAGKTTIIKTITGYLQPDEGVVEVDGFNVMSHPREVQARIGYLPENAPLYPELSVQATLKMMADLRGIAEEDQPAMISRAVYAVGLEKHLTRAIGTLSKGFRQRVGLAQAILHQPPLLILDEPTVGLDPTQIVEIRSLIKNLAGQSTVLFSTHILPEVEALCDRVIILMNGEIRANARLDELSVTSNAVVILDELPENAKSLLAGLEGVRDVQVYANGGAYPGFRVIGGDGADLTPAIYQLAAANGWRLRELRRDTRSLESIFNQIAMTA